MDCCTFFSTFDVAKLGKIRRHHWKERLEISEIAKFESDLLKTIENITPQIHEILRTFYSRDTWWREQTCPHHTNRL